IAHDGSQQWFRDDDGVRVVLTAYDPWDEGRYTGDGLSGCRFRLVPHARCLSHADRIKLAAEHSAIAADALDLSAVPVGGGTGGRAKLPGVPSSFGIVEVCGAAGVLAQALYRESAKAGEHLPAWAGHELAKRSGGACTHPIVIRLVEWNGDAA